MSENKHIRYTKGYKYQLYTEYLISTPIKPKVNIITRLVSLDTSGILYVSPGYAWDGMSGPVPDTDKNMRASLVHDALYQLMRQGSLNNTEHRKAADKLLKKICIEDGVFKFVASVYYQAVRKFGKAAAEPQNKKRIYNAPV